MPLVNLLSWRKRRLRQRARRWLALLLLQFTLVGLVLIAVYQGGHQQRLALQRELSDISGRHRQLAEQYRQTRQLWHRLRDYQAQHEADVAARHHNRRYLRLLESMAAMAPRRLWLTELADHGKYLRIAGVSENQTDIVNLHRSLTRHPDLARARLLQVQRRQEEPALLRFSLQADWAFSDAGKGGQSGD